MLQETGHFTSSFHSKQNDRNMATLPQMPSYSSSSPHHVQTSLTWKKPPPSKVAVEASVYYSTDSKVPELLARSVISEVGSSKPESVGKRSVQSLYQFFSPSKQKEDKAVGTAPSSPSPFILKPEDQRNLFANNQGSNMPQDAGLTPACGLQRATQTLTNPFMQPPSPPMPPGSLQPPMSPQVPSLLRDQVQAPTALFGAVSPQFTTAHPGNTTP
jgi:hypothetical protein